ncbi:MAG TPA: hypothetical protein VIF57_32760 [Polyangia bacterium]
MKRLALVVAAIGSIGLLLGSAPAFAQKPAKRKPAAHAASKKSAPPASAPKERAPSAASSASSDSGDSSSSNDSDDSSGGGETAATTPAPSGGKVKSKTYTFGAMDVEGKLKTPQLLYFLNRVKMELDMSAPDKRSFMKELQQSADDKNL